MPATVVACSWLYRSLALVRSVSFAMLERTCLPVVAQAVKHASAMVCVWGRKNSITTEE